MEEKNKPKIPPYVSYRTFRNFIDGLKPIPPVIDRSIMTSMSGVYQSQLLSALKYLNLIAENGTTQSNLRELAQANLEERPQVLREILENSYTFLFKPENDFDLQKGTSKQFELAFQSQGTSGDTVRRCAKFFLDAAKDAKIPISQYIKPPKSPRKRSVIKKPSPKGQENENNPEGENPDLKPPPPLKPDIVLPQWYITLKPALDLLPGFSMDPKPSWTATEKDNFLKLVTAIVTAYIDEKGRN